MESRAQDLWHTLLPLDIQGLIFDKLCILPYRPLKYAPIENYDLLHWLGLSHIPKYLAVCSSWNIGIKNAIYRNNPMSAILLMSPRPYALWAVEQFLHTRETAHPRKTSDDDDQLSQLLAIAASQNFTPAVALLTHAADLHATNELLLRQKLRRTLLGVAVAHGNIFIVKALIQAGAPLDLPSHIDPSTCPAPLLVAAKRRQTEIMKVLLQAGASTDVKSGGPLYGRWFDLWQEAVQDMYDEMTVGVLLECGLGGMIAETMYRDEEHPFVMGVKWGKRRSMRMMLDKGAVSVEEARGLRRAIEKELEETYQMRAVEKVDMRQFLVDRGVLDG